MRKILLAALAPLALVACGSDDDRPVVINTPPAVAPAPAPSTVLVPAPAQQPPAVIIDRR
jgi:hypothetical protein